MLKSKTAHQYRPFIRLAAVSILTLTTFAAALFLRPSSASAANGFALGVDLYRCSYADWSDAVCVDNDVAGDGTFELMDPDGTLIPKGSVINPGDEFIVAVVYTHGAVPIAGYQYYIDYDTALLEYVGLDAYSSPAWARGGTTYFGGVYPANGTATASQRKGTNWTFGPNITSVPGIQCAHGCIVGVGSFNAITQRDLSGTGFAFFYEFRVKSTATSGATADFSINPTRSMVSNITGSTSYTFEPHDASYCISTCSGSDLNDDKTLGEFRVEASSTNYPLSPTFTPGSVAPSATYTAYVPNSVTSVNVYTDPTDQLNAGINVAYPFTMSSLNVGANNRQFIVTAEDGTTQLYTLIVYRLSNNATLSALSASGITISPAFSSTTYSYTASVPFSTTTTNIAATATDGSKATVSGTGTFNLTNFGSTPNTAIVAVQAENCASSYASVPGNACTSQNYQIQITRANPSANANLSDLRTDGVTVPAFAPSTLTYNLPDVANSKTSLVISATTADPTATISSADLGTKSIAVGNNSFTVTITAEDGSTTVTYTINVYRKSSDTSLTALSVTSTPSGTLSPTFTSSTRSYTYTVETPANRVNITATPAPGVSITSGTGNNITITNNQFLQILTLSENGDVGYYTIQINLLDTDASLSDLRIGGTTIAGFGPGTISYSYAVPYGTTSLSALVPTPNSAQATFNVTGNSGFTYAGPNTVTITVTAGDGTTTATYTISVVWETPSSDASLSDLRAAGTTVTGFSPTTYSYTLTPVNYSVATLALAATPTDSKATVSGTGTLPLSVGNNALTITVTAEDGTTTQTYTVNIYRRSNDTSLSNLQVTSSNGGTLSPTFTSGNHAYTFTMNSPAVPVNVSATPTTGVTITSGTGTNIPVTNGQQLTVLTQSESGDTGAYTINIVVVDNDAFLSDLRVDGTTITDFDPATTGYALLVPYATTSLNLATTTRSATASTSTVGNSGFVIGVNIVTITVTAGDGITQKTYTITVTRDNPSTNALLSDLQVNGATISGFSPTTLTYTVDPVSYATGSVNISATAADPTATIQGTGVRTLTVGDNQLLVTVTAQDGLTSYTYRINIRRKSNSTSLASLSVTSSPSGTLSPSFAAGTRAYTYAVDELATHVNISATPAASVTIISGTGTNIAITDGQLLTIITQGEDGNTGYYTIEIALQPHISDDASLSDIKVDGTTLSGFSPSTFTYNISVPYATTSLNLAVVPHSSTASYQITGNSGFTVTGPNTVTIKVTAQDGTTIETYTINITRGAPSTNSLLSDLQVNSSTISGFDPMITIYTLPAVSYATTNINISATAEDPTATIAGTGTLALAVGDNTLDIVVTAQDGITKTTYKVNVRRKSNSTALASLAATSVPQGTLSPAFSPLVTDYTYRVQPIVATIDLAATPASGVSITSGTGTNISVVNGQMLTILTQSENGDTGFYRVTIDKTAVSSDARLTNLTINGTQIQNFDPTTTAYNYTVPVGTSSLNNLVATPAAGATVAISGNSGFTVAGPNVVTITVTAEDGTTTKDYTIAVTRTASTNALLADLVPSAGTLSPAFNKHSNNYQVDVDSTTSDISFTYSPEYPTATTAINPTSTTLTHGPNVFTITVTAEDGTTTNEYYITVNRAVALSSNNYLATLVTAPTGMTPAFDKDTSTYSLIVPFATISATISATAEDTRAAVSGTGAKTLTVGVNNFIITVTAEDASQRQYYLTITRQPSAPLSTNNYLATLSVTPGAISPAFDKDTTVYTVDLPETTTSINVSATPEDTKASVAGVGSTALVVGANVIIVTVTAEDSSTRQYILTVNRGTPISTDEITSDVFGHIMDSTYVFDVVPNITADVLKTQFDNPNSDLQLWNAADTTELGSSTPTATGQILKLIVGGVEVDRRIIIIKGDINGDGFIDTIDFTLLLNHTSDVIYIATPAYSAIAADINGDGNIDMIDFTILLNHVSDIIYLYP